MGEKQWKGTTYGGNRLHRSLIMALKVLDVRLIYVFSSLFVVPVCMIVNHRNTAIIYRYLHHRQGFNTLKAMWKTYMNHCLFGQVVIDRFAMYAGKKFQVETEGYEHFTRLASLPEGFVQLSAHVGNYELAGYTLVADNKPFNALVFSKEKQSVMLNRNKMFQGTNIKMIPIADDMSHVFLIDQALSQGETVSMPADRINGSEKFISKTFLGKEARFPAGPFRVAVMRGLDVLAVNVMKIGAKRYKIIITPLHYDKTATRQRQTDMLADAYVAELEKVLRCYPTQWYNYFEFWNETN